ncbi:uncharacterized protein EDB93DRAFT_1106371 [Suillus bovinus]|uniref:uncharacterized protein n=1 Tax=Suillus bovinus TaxID=48563 RepID=UPI001B868DA4|nr:uncharacterized protein EDB93DRAFT_1106371 [Suillus bovinus]KAG2138408.1 hypothetical protein EDB93DRAFT_1106371 [Suillus bovinus]
MPDPELYPTGQGDKSVFKHAIENFENFIDRANSGLDGILQMCGICEEWRAADAICKFMREMVGMVEDILLHLADGGDGELVIAFMEGELWYQEYKFPVYVKHAYMQIFLQRYHVLSLLVWSWCNGTTISGRHPTRRIKSEKGNYNNFLPPFFEKWEENWPITLEDSSEPLDENARLKQIAKARDALQTCLMVKLCNDFGNLKIGRWANAAGNTIISKLIGDITIKSGKKKLCSLNATEVYTKKYHVSRVQPAVKEELNTMKNTLDAPEPKTQVIRVVCKQLASSWENESAEVKEEVIKLAQEMKEKREKEKEVVHDKELPKELLTEILSTFFSKLHDSTGWTFSVLLAGPDPTNTGKLNVSSCILGPPLLEINSIKHIRNSRRLSWCLTLSSHLEHFYYYQREPPHLTRIIHHCQTHRFQSYNPTDAPQLQATISITFIFSIFTHFLSNGLVSFFRIPSSNFYLEN